MSPPQERGILVARIKGSTNYRDSKVWEMRQKQEMCAKEERKTVIHYLDVGWVEGPAFGQAPVLDIPPKFVGLVLQSEPVTKCCHASPAAKVGMGKLRPSR